MNLFLSSRSVTFRYSLCLLLQVRRTAAYVDEIDLHMAELTVRETFDFAARCFGSGEAPGMRLHHKRYSIHLRPLPFHCPVPLSHQSSQQSCAPASELLQALYCST